MKLYEREQPFEDKLLPLPCYVISEQERAKTIENRELLQTFRNEVLDYLETHPFVDSVQVFEEDGVMFSVYKRKELYRRQHERFCESLTVIYQVPETNTDNLEINNYYQINIGKSDLIPEEGFTLYRNGFEIATNIVDINHAQVLAFADAVDSLKNLQSILSTRLKETENLLNVLKKHGLSNDYRPFFEPIDRTDQNN